MMNEEYQFFFFSFFFFFSNSYQSLWFPLMSDTIQNFKKKPSINKFENILFMIDVFIITECIYTLLQFSVLENILTSFHNVYEQFKCANVQYLKKNKYYFKSVFSL